MCSPPDSGEDSGFNMKKEYYCKFCDQEYAKEELLKYARCPICNHFVAYGDKHSLFMKEAVRMRLIQKSDFSPDDIAKLKMLKMI